MAMSQQTVEEVHKFQDEGDRNVLRNIDYPRPRAPSGDQRHRLPPTQRLAGVRLGYLPQAMAAWAEAPLAHSRLHRPRTPDGSL